MGDNRGVEILLTEAHFCGLQSQSNVYGLCKIDLSNRPSELLISSLMGEIVSLKFDKNKPLSKEVRFTYIPGDAEIISIDAFNKFHHGNNVVIGISFMKVLKGKSCCYLNIYSEWQQTVDFNLDSITQGWHNIELNFVPYQLSHTEFVYEGNVEIIFLLTGGDARVHMFREDKYSQLFTEVSDCELYFPEFSNLPSNVTWLQCEYYQDYQKRVSAMGFFNGTVKLAIVNTQSLEIINIWTIEHDSPITSVRLFTLKSDVECPHFVSEVMDSLEDPMEYSTPEYNLLVNTAVEASVVYRNIPVNGLECPVTLQDSDQYDCVLCGSIADVDLDGYNEVIIGTYGQEMLVYKFVPDISHQKESLSTTILNIESQQSTMVNNTDKSDDCNVACPATTENERPVSLNLTEEPSQNSTSSKTEVQSPLDFHSGHFNTDMSPLATISGEETKKSKDDVSEKCGVDKLTTDLEEKVNLGDATDNEKVKNGTNLKQDTGSRENVNKYMSNIYGLTTSTSSKCTDKSCSGNFELLWKQSFSEPVYSIDTLDTTGDGLEELIVLTQKGIHILQHDINKAAELCLQRLKQATFHQGPHDDVFNQLLSENLLGSYHEDSNINDECV